jgi:transcriptional regulator with XRE-family HTH domain
MAAWRSSHPPNLGPRALLGIRQVDLAERAGVSQMMIKRYEAGTHDIRATMRDRIEMALVAAGIELINEPGRVGAVLRNPTT